MKKFNLLFMIFALLLAVACSKDDDTGKNTSSDNPTDQTDDKDDDGGDDDNDGDGDGDGGGDDDDNDGDGDGDGGDDDDDGDGDDDDDNDGDTNEELFIGDWTPVNITYNTSTKLPYEGKMVPVDIVSEGQTYNFKYKVSGGLAEAIGNYSAKLTVKAYGLYPVAEEELNNQSFLEVGAWTLDGNVLSFRFPNSPKVLRTATIKELTKNKLVLASKIVKTFKIGGEKHDIALTMLSEFSK